MKKKGKRGLKKLKGYQRRKSGLLEEEIRATQTLKEKKIEKRSNS